MNADLVQLADGLSTLLEKTPWLLVGQVAVAVVASVALVRLLSGTQVFGRTFRAFEQVLFTNWRLALLGTTAVVLSLVSGYTTFDGLRNFTGGGLLSLLATVGIQGVMLVTAWLIGESFATGMSQRASDGTVRRPADPWIGGMLGIALVSILLIWLLRSQNAIVDPFNWTRNSADALSRFADTTILFVAGLVVLGVVFLNRTSDLALPYVQGTRVIIKNLILWVMFLICMAASVFFSFDSHFSGIFSPSERKRAADIRSVNQVAGVVADIGARIQSRQIEEAQRLFETDAWLAYERQLDAVTRLANDSPRLIREQISRELEEQKSRIAALEEKRANAQSSAAGLGTRKMALAEELTRLSAERPEVATQVQSQKSVVAEVERRLDEQRAKTLAEEKGVEGSGKVGQGQFWRASKAEEAKIQAELQVARERLRPAEARLVAIDRRLAAIKSEVAQIDGDLAKLRGEAETAGQMISVAQSSRTSEQQSFDPASGVAALERARQTFRQKPELDGLGEIQSQCATLVSAAGRVTDLKDQAARIDCDPKQASEAAARVFALNQGLRLFSRNCAGGERLPQTGGTDALLTFGRKCLQDSGLPSKDTGEMAARLSALDLARDDKAHRFVVTLNAFKDGNHLAYLALAIAITIDGLIFMSGLFGANAVRSPLSDVPTTKARSARQLEDIIDSALLPHRFDNARAVLGAMRPMTPRDGFSAWIAVDEQDPHAADIHRVLNAGATIGAVRHVASRDPVYEVRSELFEYLASVSRREFEANREHVNLAELERTIAVALLPDVAHGAETVLHYLRPIEETTSFKEWVKEQFNGPHGFTNEIVLSQVTEADRRVVVRALGAGSTLRQVQRRDSHGDSYYFVTADYHKVLMRIRARLMLSGAAHAQIPGQSGEGPRQGGRLDARHPELGRDPIAGRLEAPRPRADVSMDGAGDASPAAGRPPASASAGANAQLPVEADDDVRNRYWSRLIAAMGLDPAVVSQQLNDPGTYHPIMAAWKALKSRTDRPGSPLGKLLAEREDDQANAISGEYSLLRSETRGDKRLRELLQDVSDQIETYRAALLLFPELGLIDDLIGRLEAAAQPDDGLLPGEQPLKDTLVAVRAKLAPGRGPRSAQTWAQVHDLLRAADAQSSIARLPPQPGANTRRA